MDDSKAPSRMTETSLKKSLAARSLFGFGLQIVLRLRGLLLVPILTRALSPAELGVISLGNALTSGLSPLLLLGLHTGLALELVHLQDRAIRPAILTVFAFSSLFAISVTLLILGLASTGLFGPAVAPLLTVLWPVGLYAVALTLREVANALPQVRQKLRFIGWNSVLMDFGGAIAAITLVLSGFGAYGALLGAGSMSLLGALIAAVYSLRLAKGPWTGNAAFLTATIRTALPVVPLAFGLWALQSSDYFFVSYHRGPADVAIYGLAYNLASPALMALAAMNLTYLPTCVEILREGRGPFARFMDDSTRLFSVGGVAAVATALAAGPEITAWLAGPTYRESGRVLPVIVAAYVFFSLSQLQQFIPGAMTRDMKGSARAHAVAAVVNLGANALLVPRFGIWGAAWSTLGAYALAFSLLARTVKAQLPELTWTRELGRIVALGIGSFGIAFVLQQATTGAPTALICGGVAAVLTLVTAAGLGLLTRNDLARLRAAWPDSRKA